MANEADEWRTPHFRQKVTNQIDEALRKSGNPQMMTKNAADIERDVFSKAKSRDEYMCYVARVLVFARDLSAGRSQAGIRPGHQPGQPGQVIQQMGITRQQMHPGIGPQVVRQPFTVTQISTAPSMTASIANQQHQQGKPQMQFKIMSTIQQQPQINAPAITMAQVSQTQQFSSLSGTQTQQVQSQAQSLMVSSHQHHTSSQMNLTHSQPSFSMSSAGSHLMQHQSPAMSGRPSNPSPAIPAVAPSPAGFNAINSPAPTAQHGMTPSPQTFVAQSPAPQSVPTPGIPNVQSPASILNGPASVGPPVTSPAPLSAAEEQAYLEKHKQLSMYIEPLTRMINRMNQEHSKHSTNDLKKLKNFLDILENPARRVSLNVLERCEQVLKKLNLKPPTQRPGTTISPSPSTTAQTTSKPITSVNTTSKPFAFQSEEQLSGQALLDTVVKHLKSPLFSHTLKRTFSPIVQAMDGPPICPPPPPYKKLRVSEIPTKKCPLPHTLQGELARLCDRFRVKPEINSSNSQSSMLLTCSIEDELLPAVPPIEITVPQNYPHSSPACKTVAYETTPFLLKIQSQLLSELRRMPGFYSVTSLLNAWEASIRLACISEVPVK